MALMQSGWVLSDDLLERCARRAADYDRENRFFLEDFDELRELGVVEDLRFRCVNDCVRRS